MLFAPNDKLFRLIFVALSAKVRANAHIDFLFNANINSALIPRVFTFYLLRIARLNLLFVNRASNRQLKVNFPDI